jgi:hypothetical protein
MDPDAYMGNPAALAGLTPDELDSYMLWTWVKGRKAEYGVFLREWQRRSPDQRNPPPAD